MERIVNATRIILEHAHANVDNSPSFLQPCFVKAQSRESFHSMEGVLFLRSDVKSRDVCKNAVRVCSAQEFSHIASCLIDSGLAVGHREWDYGDVVAHINHRTPLGDSVAAYLRPLDNWRFVKDMAIRFELPPTWHSVQRIVEHELSLKFERYVRSRSC